MRPAACFCPERTGRVLKSADSSRIFQLVVDALWFWKPEQQEFALSTGALQANMMDLTRWIVVGQSFFWYANLFFYGNRKGSGPYCAQ